MTSQEGGGKATTAVPGAVGAGGKRPISLEEMTATCADVATSIETMERGRVAAGFVGFEDPAKLRQSEVIFAVALFLDRLAPIMPQVRKLLAPKVSSGSYGGGDKPK